MVITTRITHTKSEESQQQLQQVQKSQGSHESQQSIATIAAITTITTITKITSITPNKVLWCAENPHRFPAVGHCRRGKLNVQELFVRCSQHDISADLTVHPPTSPSLNATQHPYTPHSFVESEFILLCFFRPQHLLQQVSLLFICGLCTLNPSEPSP